MSATDLSGFSDSLYESRLSVNVRPGVSIESLNSISDFR